MRYEGRMGRALLFHLHRIRPVADGTAPGLFVVIRDPNAGERVIQVAW